MTSAGLVPQSRMRISAHEVSAQHVHIVKEIPGSDLQVSFTFFKDADNKQHIQTTVIRKSRKAKVSNVPIEPFLNTPFDQIPIKQALETLRTHAIDYVCGEIIFLPKNILRLLEEWKINKTANHPDADKNRKNYIDRLKINLKLIEKFLIESKKTNRNIIYAYFVFGDEYFCTSKYREALAFFRSMFCYANELKDQEGIGLAHRGLGCVYQKLYESDRALAHYMQALISDEKLSRLIETEWVFLNLGKIFSSQERSDQALIDFKRLKASLDKEKRWIFLNLGYIFSGRGMSDQALLNFKRVKASLEKKIERTELAHIYSCMGREYLNKQDYPTSRNYFNKSLEIEESAEALYGLGATHSAQIDHEKAIANFDRALEKIRGQKGNNDYIDEFEINAYCGLSYFELGQHSKAEEYHKASLQIAEKANDSKLILNAYFNLMGLYMAQNKYCEASKYIKPVFPYLKIFNDTNPWLEGRLSYVASRFYFLKEKNNLDLDCKQCLIHFHKEHVRWAAQCNNTHELVFAYAEFGATCTDLGEWPDAIDHYKQAIRISENTQDCRFIHAGLHYSLGYAHFISGNYKVAEKCFSDSIALHSNLLKENCQNNLQWQISFFEKQFRPYRMLEKVVLKTDTDQALLIADSSRSRSLLSCLKDKLKLVQTVELSLEAIKGLAIRLKTTFVLYSCFDPFDEAWCWVISAEKVTFRKLNLTQIAPLKNWQAETTNEVAGEEFQRGVSRWISAMESEATRSHDDSTQVTFNQDRLKKWYVDFIAPIEDSLPQNGERVAFVPDAAIHDVPFALFQNEKGEYLFEKWTLIIAPSIETLLCLEKLNKENLPSRKRDCVCTITCPKAHEQFNLNQLVGVDEEKKHIHDCFTNYEELDPSNVESMKEKMAKFGHIHIACHGLSDEKENEHSVFEGALALTDPQSLYSEDIIKLSLNASLVFMSACSSGHGKRFREGSIGLPFACLAGGASSVIATRWSISDMATPKIVEKFYEHYLGQTEVAQAALAAGKSFGQAEALREAMLFAKQVFPDRPHVWGAFFLIGLPGDFRGKDVFAELGEFILDSSTRVWVDKDTTLLFNLKEGKMTATQYMKDGTKKIFPEESIKASLKSFAQRRSGIPQKTGELNNWTLVEKEELFSALLTRKIVINTDRILITANPKKESL